MTRSTEEWARTPYAISIVGEQQIQRGERALSLDQALRGIPGVTVQNRQNLSLGDRLIVRGAGARAQFGVRGVMIIADGIPLTLPDGQAVLSNLDLLAAGRAEVIRGPASSLYGNAAGGVISFRTEDFASTPLHAQAQAAFGNYGFATGRLKLSGTTGSTGRDSASTTTRTLPVSTSPRARLSASAPSSGRPGATSRCHSPRTRAR